MKFETGGVAYDTRDLEYPETDPWPIFFVSVVDELRYVAYLYETHPNGGDNDLGPKYRSIADQLEACLKEELDIA